MGLSLSKNFIQSDIILKIVGRGDAKYKAQIQNLVSVLNLNQKVYFIEYVDGDEKSQLYADALFTFLPSHSENFGNVVVESLAQGTPVVASINTPWQILENQKAGFWCTNSPSEIANIIDKIIKLSFEEYQTYRLNAYQLVVEHFDVYENINKRIEIYHNMIEI